LWKNEIRGFWDVRVGKASKCPQMSTVKVLVHKSFELDAFCTWSSWSVHHGMARRLGGEFCEKMKFVVFEMWGLEWPPNASKWIPWKSWCTKVLSSEGFAHGQVGRCTTAWLDGLWGVLWKNEIRGFWDVRVRKASKCPQMSTVRVLVHKSFELDAFCTWPSWSVHRGMARRLGGEFCEKMKFVVFEMWGLERPTNVPKRIPWKSWCTKVLSSEGFAHVQVGRCTATYLDGLVGSFVKKWNLWFLRCEGWIGLQMSPNEYHESLGARKFWVRWVLHLAKLVGVPRHS